MVFEKYQVKSCPPRKIICSSYETHQLCLNGAQNPGSHDHRTLGNFDEKVHKPQSRSYARIGANMTNLGL